MYGKTKVSAFLFAMLLPAFAGSILAQPPDTDPAGPAGPASSAQIPNTGINSDVSFPAGLDPICGLKVTVYGSEPVNLYTGSRMPTDWQPPVIEEDKDHPGYWTITFKGKCIDRNDPRWWECGVFKGVHFGFYTDDPVIHFLNPDPGVWSQVGPPCVFFDKDGKEVPCGALTSHGFGDGAVVLHADTLAAAAANSRALSHGLLIQNAQIAVAADLVAINDLGPCALHALPWRALQLVDNVLPLSKDGVGTLEIPIPDSILSQKGWAVMTYDVADPDTGEVLTSSTLEFPLP